MTVAAYSTDLNLMDDASSSTGWAEATASGWTSVFAVTGGETDDYIQNTTCNSTTVKTGVGVLLYNNGSGITLNQDDAVLVWAKWDVYPSLDVESNGGIRTVMGSSLSAFYGFKHLGSDSYIYDGWINLATGDPADSNITPDYTVGSPTTTKQYHGWAFNALSVPSKGNPYKVDAIRYGRCEIICINGDATRYGRFDDMAQENDYNDATNGYNRWGLFRKVTANNYLWKGLMSLGNATVVDFRDSNATISVDNTKHVTPAFNAIEINNASSRVDWTGITISALGTVSPGTLTVVDNADVNFQSNVFNDMGAFSFLANSTIIDNIFRRCGLVTTGGGTFTGCIFDEPSGAVGVTASSPANAALITNATFNSDGTGNGLEITGTAADFTLTNVVFSGYSTTVDANKAIYVNIATGTVNITISGGSGVTLSSHVRTAGATVNIISGAVTVQVKAALKDGTAVENARVYLRASDGTGPFPFEDSVTITRATTTATVAHTAHGMATNDKVTIAGITDKTEDNGIHQITVTGVNAYTFTTTDSGSTSYTGTITSTFVALSGLTAATGLLSTSRVYSSNQPVVGWTRKSTSSPFLQEGVLVGEIDSTDGFNGTAVMLSDE